MTQAEHDALTGLRNHGAFQRELGLLIERDQPFGLMMLDLDAFKAYNDWHGHPEGDALLGRIALAMSDALRDGDRVYRYGGDEFAILLPGITSGAIREVTDRIRTVGRAPDRGDRAARHDQRRRRALPRRRPREGRAGRRRRPRPLPRQARRPPAPRRRRPDPRPVPRRHRPDDAAVARAPRAPAAAARDRRPGRRPGRRQARLPVPARGQRAGRRPRVPRRRRAVRRPRRLPPPARHRHRLDRGPVGAADERRRLRRLSDAGGRPRCRLVRRRVRGAAHVGRRGPRAHRARLGRSRAAVHRARARGAVPVREARVDRARQRPPVRTGADRGPAARPRRPPRPADRPAEPDAAAQPARRAPRPGRLAIAARARVPASR